MKREQRLSIYPLQFGGKTGRNSGDFEKIAGNRKRVAGSETVGMK